MSAVFDHLSHHVGSLLPSSTPISVVSGHLLYHVCSL
ncbi:unnamed protein product [Staurois parvus]|uniref:Uncharacterized protein n=1 Tax=Staurois parvus TaxID=386267 RepID=A0ABN9H8Y4_9NEOB|nr:unnamed protein product [Staurois parvus]